ncbi:MAG: TauD/TfdA family dioxygenase [Alphaproteobacteria bacterium]|jgi:taurine dioxygenase|nr:taurine dioxygenase [Rhodospirillaceae bacterium]MBT7614623.1 taurine dioxygenase [Rhodospirillaceae bacterium]MDG2480625.1 TauD/TfdA family dioxygenase [Alphaproteobacteria bacterium]
MAGSLGAEISGVDLSKSLSNEVFAGIHQAFLDHLVIYFRDQNLTPAQHRDFALRFFKLEEHPYVEGIAEVPEITEIVKEPEEHRNWGGPWHADVTFKEEPSIGAALYARDVPPYGGDTGFANMYLAWETLSDGMKALIDGLEAFHDSSGYDYSTAFRGMRGKAAAGDRALHPVVRTHPETGRKALFVSRAYTTHFKDMTPAESKPLLEYLFDHASRIEHTTRIRWEKGSLAVWDNRVTMHCAIDDDFAARNGGNGFRRVLHRATFAGQKPM